MSGAGWTIVALLAGICGLAVMLVVGTAIPGLIGAAAAYVCLCMAERAHTPARRKDK